MSTRSRSRPAARSYTARLQERASASRRKQQRKPLPAWVTGPRLPALLAVCAELGHLAAGFVEWPGAWWRGVAQVVAAAALGLLAVGVYFGPARRVPGIVLTVALPAGWLVGAVAGWSPYRDFPVLGAVVLVMIELMIAALLVRRLKS